MYKKYVEKAYFPLPFNDRSMVHAKKGSEKYLPPKNQHKNIVWYVDISSVTTHVRLNTLFASRTLFLCYRFCVRSFLCIGITRQIVVFRNILHLLFVFQSRRKLMTFKINGDQSIHIVVIFKMFATSAGATHVNWHRMIFFSMRHVNWAKCGRQKRFN